MRVLHVIPSIAPCRGGPSAAILAMTQALAKQGVQCDIVTTNDNGTDVLPVKTGAMMDYGGSQVCFLPRWSPKVGALREFQYSSAFPAWLNAALPHYDGLHVHAVFSYLSTRAMMLARAHGVPYITRPLGQLDAWSLQQKALKKRLYFRLVERRNLQGAAAIHCTSNTEATNVQNLLPHARVEVIPHGIESPVDILHAATRLRESLKLPPDEPVILFLSRWHPKKNIPLLLEALAGMSSERWTLVLAGTAEGDYAATIHECIRRNGLVDRVQCPGHVQGEAKALLLQGADAFVLPSSSENFGISVAEALVVGLPAIVTHEVDISPVVKSLNGGQVCETNVESLRTALQHVLLSPPDRTALKHSARLHFDWAKSAIRLRELYAQVFPNKSRSSPA